MTSTRLPSGLLDAMASGGRVVFLTGSGVSAESGVPTFRDALTGLWARYRPEDLATPEAFARDPLTVWRWYQSRRQGVASVAPNPGHRAIARLQQMLGGSVLVTQNVDGLHQRAGSADPLEFHGNLFRDRCEDCGHRRAVRDLQLDTPPACPRCGGVMRPDVVWFGESIPADVLDASWRAAASSSVFFSIGTSGLVYPAAELADVAKWNGAGIVEINTESTPLTPRADWVLTGSAGVVLPALADQLGGRLGGTGGKQ
jgi:NAD-dependent deacetylase